MKVVVAIDSFKGSLTSIEAGNAFPNFKNRYNAYKNLRDTAVQVFRLLIKE